MGAPNFVETVWVLTKRTGAVCTWGGSKEGTTKMRTFSTGTSPVGDSSIGASSIEASSTG